MIDDPTNVDTTQNAQKFKFPIATPQQLIGSPTVDWVA